MSEPKHNTRVVNVILVLLGLVLFVFGIFSWQSYNSVAGMLITSIERQDYTIPSSVSVNFRQMALVYTLMTLIGWVLAFAGAVNEANSLFEVVLEPTHSTKKMES